MHNITSTPKRSYNIFRQEAGITAGNIHISIRYFQVTVENIFKFRYELYFIN